MAEMAWQLSGKNSNYSRKCCCWDNWISKWEKLKLNTNLDTEISSELKIET